MHRLPDFKDVEDLKFKVASDPTTIAHLANFAHLLGYAWCHGTASPKNGEDFEVTRDGEKYVLQARYDPHDRYVDNPSGYHPHDFLVPQDKGHRLQITLSNFRFRFNPASFTFGDPVISAMDPMVSSSYLARNESDTEDDITKSFDYQLMEEVQHTTSHSFTKTHKVEVSTKFTIKNLWEIGGGYNFTWGNTDTWSDCASTTSGHVDTISYNGKLQPHMQRLISLVVNRVSSDVTYTGLAAVGFDIDFAGFMPGDLNAVVGLDLRNKVTLHFGDAQRDGLADIWNRWDHHDIPEAKPLINWNAMIQNYEPADPWIGTFMTFFRDGVGAPISGTFSGIKGAYVFVTAGQPTPIPDKVTTRPTLRGTSRRLAQTPFEEVPGVRVLNIE